jgi:hypothetical protein
MLMLSNAELDQLIEYESSEYKTLSNKLGLLTLSMLHSTAVKNKLYTVDVAHLLSDLLSHFIYHGANSHESYVKDTLEVFDTNTVFTRAQVQRYQDQFMALYANTGSALLSPSWYKMDRVAAFTPRTVFTKRNKRNRKNPETSPLVATILKTLSIPENILTHDTKGLYPELRFVIKCLQRTDAKWGVHYQNSHQRCSLRDRDHLKHYSEKFTLDASNEHMVQVRLASLVNSGHLHPVEALIATDLSTNIALAEVIEITADHTAASAAQAVRVVLTAGLSRDDLCTFSTVELAELSATGQIEDLTVSLVRTMVPHEETDHEGMSENEHKYLVSTSHYELFRDVPQWTLWDTTHAVHADTFQYLDEY